MKCRNTKLARSPKAAKGHAHTWRPWQFAKKTGIVNPDKTGLLVHCQGKGCDAIELVAPQSVPVFFALLKQGVEPVVATSRNKLPRRASVARQNQLWIQENEEGGPPESARSSSRIIGSKFEPHHRRAAGHLIQSEGETKWKPSPRSKRSTCCG